MTTPSFKVDVGAFVQRVNKLYSSWNNDLEEVWQGVDAISISSPPSSDELRYYKSTAIQVWLLSYEFPDTSFVFLRHGKKKAFHVLCSRSKTSLLEYVKQECKSRIDMEFLIHVKEKKEDGTAQMQKILESIKAISSEKPIKLGNLGKEQVEGGLTEKWQKILDESGFEKADVGSAFGELLSVKDEAEITNVKKASFLSASVMKSFVVPKLETVIDEEQAVTHEKLMESTEEVIGDPLKIKVKLKPENCDICYPPIFQSGGNFDLKPSAMSSKDPLYYDQMGVVICALGSRYASYCSNVARTYLIDATAEQEKAYLVLLKAQEAAIATLKPGTTCSSVYKAALQVVEKESPHLVPFLTKNVGSGIGLEFRESLYALNAKNEQKIKAGMIFNVSIGFQGLSNPEAKDQKAKNYALLLADTIVVRVDKPEVCTNACTKAFSDVGYSFKGDEEESDEKRPVLREDALSLEDRKTKLRSENQEATKEEARRKHQQELAEQKLEETVRRLKDGGNSVEAGAGARKDMSDMVAYKTMDDIPYSRELIIQVDQKNESILLPIYGVMVPFHISTVKTVSSQQDGGHSYIRVIFNIPGGGLSATDIKFPDSIYLKEVSFRSTDVRHSNQVVQQIKTISRQIKQRESEKAERATLVTQEKLIPAKGRPLRLADLWIRPNFGGRGRKLTGVLEAHVNGFRYQTARGDERVDVMYRNIKHAIFQPAENEMITVLHFHLHNPIMVGTKKTKDVQFFVEVMEANQNVGGYRRSGYDPDEIEEEQRERARKNKINSEFKLFAKKVQDQWEQTMRGFEVEFDVPFRDLGFYGVPHKSSAFIVPTVNCLVELIEMPFVVITLQEIEIVSLERVGLGQKTFDMRVVFKDFKRDVFTVDAIPSTSADSLKEWLNSVNIKYYESRLNLSWRPILQNIIADPDSFIESGGWEFLNVEASDTEPESEASDAYRPSDVEEEEDESDEDSEDNESVVNSEEEEENEDSEDEEEEEEGLSWDELEERAKREDRENGRDSDSEEDKRKRKGGSVQRRPGGGVGLGNRPVQPPARKPGLSGVRPGVMNKGRPPPPPAKRHRI